jgi:Raf kinase inhibitor-like YbhB/YbcL family protein
MQAKTALFAVLFLFMLFAGCSRQEGFEDMGEMKVTSPSFSDGGWIPDKHACRGENISPRLDVSGIPDGAKSLVLIVDDPDAPMKVWVHWVVFNIPPVSLIPEGELLQGSIEGMNDFGTHEYGGPCPPSGIHRYFFKAYALDAMLDLGDYATKQDVEAAMKGHILAQADLVGKYEKQ